MLTLEDYQKEIEYGEIENVDYNNIIALNASSIKLGSKNLNKMNLALQGKYYVKKKVFDFGSEFHYYLFEPGKFNELYYISDKHLGKKLNTDKAAILRETVFNNGKNRIDLREGEKMKRMKDSLLKHPALRELIETEGKIEQTLIWKDSTFKLNCKGRIDKLIHQSKRDCAYIVDLKTTKDSSAEYFPKDFRSYGYGIQAAFYIDGYLTLFENKNVEFWFIAIDKEYPYDCEAYIVSEKTLNKYREEYKKIISEWIRYKNDPSVIYEPKVL